MYSIYRQETTGLWAVRDDSTGKVVSRGDNPEIAINVAISRGMPPENKEALQTEAEFENDDELARAEAQNAKAEETLPEAQAAQTEQQNNQYQAEGGADDDSGSSSSYYESDGTASTSTTEYYENDGTPSSSDTSEAGGNDGTSQTTFYENDGTSSSSIGTTVAGKSGTAKSKVGSSKPGKRYKNPLGDYSSYTYQITLYMITPDVYNSFVTSGRSNISQLLAAQNPGVYIVAQSGGVNTSISKRAPGFNYDYYIDNLTIETAAGGKETGGAFAATEMSFNIFEPYGFSFIKNLKTAMDAIQKNSRIKGMDQIPNASRNFFMLGVRFLGYDANGNVFVGDSSQQGLNSTKTSSNNPGTLERFWDIVLHEIKFKIDGKMTTYTCSAKIVATQAGYGVKYGRLKNDVTVTASTVEEALSSDDEDTSIGLFTQINKQQQDLVDAGKIEIANKYECVFVGKAIDTIAPAEVYNKRADPDKTKLPVTGARNSDQLNEAVAVNTKPDTNTRNIVFKNDTSILQCIQLVISQSSYLENALKQLYTTDVEPDPDTDSPETVVNTSKRTLTYYNVSSNVEILGYDTKVKDFAYKITYVIEPYEIPYVQAVGSNLSLPYYGPHKRYEYWFTGENTEIIRFEQSYDNLYFLVAVGGDIAQKEAGIANDDTPVVPDLRQNSPRQGKLGIGAEAQNAVTNFLTDPKSQAEAKITILGDPDYLMYPNTNRYNNDYDPFYGVDGYTINPGGGQVFVEIDFKEAVDYDDTKGVMTVNDKILFNKYPPAVAKVAKGVIYLVVKVKNEFRNGTFQQTLDMKLATFTTKNQDASAGGRENQSAAETARLQRGAANQDNPTGSNATGFKSANYDEFAGVDDQVAYQQSLNEADQADAFYNGQSTSNTGGGDWGDPVQDDDSSFDPMQGFDVEEEGRE